MTDNPKIPSSSSSQPEPKRTRRNDPHAAQACEACRGSKKKCAVKMCEECEKNVLKNCRHRPCQRCLEKGIQDKCGSNGRKDKRDPANRPNKCQATTSKQAPSSPTAASTPASSSQAGASHQQTETTETSQAFDLTIFHSVDGMLGLIAATPLRDTSGDRVMISTFHGPCWPSSNDASSSDRMTPAVPASHTVQICNNYGQEVLVAENLQPLPSWCPAEAVPPSMAVSHYPHAQCSLPSSSQVTFASLDSGSSALNSGNFRASVSTEFASRLMQNIHMVESTGTGTSSAPTEIIWDELPALYFPDHNTLLDLFGPAAAALFDAHLGNSGFIMDA